jgi:trehalose 2-sulfotransferase
MGGLFHNLRHPRRCYAVCAIPRSGSNLLTDGLHTTRRAGRPKQFFLRKTEPEFAATHNLDLSTGFPAYVRDIARLTATSNEVFGFKLMSWYLNDFLGRLRETGDFGGTETSDLQLLRNAFPRLRFVHVVRGHKLRQALSKARAAQTDLWKVQEGKTVRQKPQFDADLIEQCLRDGEQQEQVWQGFFQRTGIDPFRVEYEKLCENYEATIRAVLDFLQISLPRGQRIGPPVTVRQADEISRVWEERFLAERSPAIAAQI